MSGITRGEQRIGSPPKPQTLVTGQSGAKVAGPRDSRVAWRRLRRVAPTLTIVGVLAGLAVWGHTNDWTLPKFSSLIGGSTAADDDWCTDHNVPSSECIECNPALIPPEKDFGWCKVHGVAQCPLEHPEVAQLKTPPTITPAALERASRALALKPRTQNNSRCSFHQRRIQFASAQTLAKAGVDIAVVSERPIVEAVVANGEVVYDQNRIAHLSSRAAGTAWRVERQVGDRVRKGDILALVDAPEVGRAKTQFIQAIADVRLKQANVEQLRPLANDQLVSKRQIRDSEAAYQEARIKLQSAQQALVNLGLPIDAYEFAAGDNDQLARRIQFLGLPADFISSFDPTSTTSNLLPLQSPLDGVIVDRHVVAGEVVDTTGVLFTVADTSQLWLTLHVRQEEARYVALGQSVLFRPSDLADEPEITGAVRWISTAVDDETRTVRVRADLPNPDGRLRANTFGAGRIVLREEPKAVVVPAEAVHWDGNCHVVFVRDKYFLRADAPKFFHVRSVRPGVKDAELVEIIAGLVPGEVIASKNSSVLEAQLLKSNLGAGCCEACAPKK